MAVLVGGSCYSSVEHSTCCICDDRERRRECSEETCGHRGTLRCDRCHAVWYCSEECRRAHWASAHKRSCESLRYAHRARPPNVTAPGIGRQRPIQMGCACRGERGLAHVSCMTERAATTASTTASTTAASLQETMRTVAWSPWTTCQVCGDDFMGEMRLSLARAWDERTSDRQPDDDERVAALTNLGNALTHAAKFDDSIAVLQPLRETLAHDDPRWIRIMTDIGRNIMRKRQDAKAEEHFRRLLDDCHRASYFESYRVEIQEIMTALVASLLLQDKHAEAEIIQKDLLDMIIRTLGPEHPSTFEAAITLSFCMYSQDGVDKKAQAMCILQESLRYQLIVQGSEHPGTLQTRHLQSIVLFQQGNFEESVRVAEDVLEKMLRVLGESHPDTMWLMSELSTTLLRVGQHERAVQMKRRCLELRRRILGRDHSKTLKTSNELDAMLDEIRASGEGCCTQSPREGATMQHPQQTSSCTVRCDERHSELRPDGACNASKCKSNDAVYVCSKCGLARYCSRDCQRADWKRHKPTCTPNECPASQ